MNGFVKRPIRPWSRSTRPPRETSSAGWTCPPRRAPGLEARPGVPKAGALGRHPLVPPERDPDPRGGRAARSVRGGRQRPSAGSSATAGVSACSRPWTGSTPSANGSARSTRTRSRPGRAASASASVFRGRPRPSRVVTRRLTSRDRDAFTAIAPPWGLRGWRSYPALIEHAAAFGVPDGDGFVALAWVFDQADLYDALGVYTVPRYRRLGLGRAAASALFAHVVHACGRVPLWSTRPDNEPSRARPAPSGSRRRPSSRSCAGRPVRRRQETGDRRQEEDRRAENGRLLVGESGFPVIGHAGACIILLSPVSCLLSPGPRKCPATRSSWTSAGGRALVVGLGTVGRRKAAGLLAAGAGVIGVDPAGLPTRSLRESTSGPSRTGPGT